MKKIEIKDSINKYIYTTYNKSGYQILYIGKCVDRNENTLLFDKSYFFTIPIDNHVNCFCYDTNNSIEVTNDMTLYELTMGEYVDTFRNFVTYHGVYKDKLPTKIVADIQ